MTLVDEARAAHEAVYGQWTAVSDRLRSLADLGAALAGES